MNKNYLPLYEDKDEDCLSYITQSNFNFEEYRKDTEVKLSVKESVQKICEFMEKNYVTDEDKKIFNKILGDQQILSKLIFVYDGSYRNNRIFFKRFNYRDMSSNACDIECRWLSKRNYNKYKDMSNKNKLNFLKNNFEFIFIQLIPDHDDHYCWDDNDDYDYDYITSDYDYFTEEN